MPDQDVKVLEYYATQGSITDPGEYRECFEDLPRDIAGLCQAVQGLVIHFQEEDLHDYVIPENRLPEIEIRSMTEMLARIQSIDDRPLVEARPVEKRLVGSCRDFAVLFCAMARHHNTPTRVRVGFAYNPHDDFYEDHIVAECWDMEDQRWKLVDPQMSKHHIETYKIKSDVHDLPRDRFVVGGQAWQMCRLENAAPSKFGIYADWDIKGMGFIRQTLVQDLAALNKMELLPWDCWGLTLKRFGTLSDEDLQLLDDVADLTQAVDEVFLNMQATYERQSSLRIPEVVVSYNPVAGASEVRVPFQHFS